MKQQKKFEFKHKPQVAAMFKDEKTDVEFLTDKKISKKDRLVVVLDPSDFKRLLKAAEGK